MYSQNHRAASNKNNINDCDRGSSFYTHHVAGKCSRAETSFSLGELLLGAKESAAGLSGRISDLRNLATRRPSPSLHLN
jgi:hypothetical protein